MSVAAARIRISVTLVVICEKSLDNKFATKSRLNFTGALMSIFIVSVPSVTFALEASRYVHANAVLTHLRHESALVDFFGESSHWIDNGARSIAAQLQVFSYICNHNVRELNE